MAHRWWISSRFSRTSTDDQVRVAELVPEVSSFAGFTVRVLDMARGTESRQKGRSGPFDPAPRQRPPVRASSGAWRAARAAR